MGAGGEGGGTQDWNSLWIMTSPWQQAWETGGLGRGERRRRRRERKAELQGGSEQHWYIAMETLLHRQSWGGGSHHLASPEGTPALRTPALLLSPFPTSHDTPGALASARQSQIRPSWRVGGNTDQQTKQPGRAGRREVERDNFSDSHWFAFHLSGSIWTTQMYLFSHPRWL